MLRTPLIMFFIGAILAALVYVPLFAVASQATTNITNQVTAFFLNKREFEELQGYGLNCAGRIVVYVLLLSSSIMFGVGIYKCISVLGRLS